MVRIYFYEQNNQGFRESRSLTHKVTEILTSSAYVRVIALVFSRAFDMVRHAYPSEHIAILPVPDAAYN